MNEPSRAEIRHWLQTVLQQTKLTPTALARRAGVAQSTLTRFLNSETAPMIGMRSIAKIAHAAGVQPYGLPPGAAGAMPARADLEGDAVPLRGEAGEPAPLVAAMLQRLPNAVDPWLLQSNALELAGFLTGDILLVDLNATPHTGDVVCAQLYKWSEGRALTVFRLFEPPYLIAMARDPTTRRPFLVDNDRVVIKGVVVATVRPRPAAQPPYRPPLASPA